MIRNLRNGVGHLLFTPLYDKIGGGQFFETFIFIRSLTAYKKIKYWRSAFFSDSNKKNDFVFSKKFFREPGGMFR
jgi:hypothetical protein